MIYGFWLGDKPLSELSIKCTSTWPKDNSRIYRTVAEIETDFPAVKEYNYFYEALEAKHIVAASDLFRLLVVNSGGIYLDSDVEIVNLQKLYDLEYKAVSEKQFIIGYEDNRYLCAAVLISARDSAMSTRLLRYYKETPFAETYPVKNISTRIFTGHIEDNPSEAICVPEKTFYQWRWNEKISEQEKKRRQSNSQTIVTHHWEGTWLPKH